MSNDPPTSLQRHLLVHLLAHRGAQVRFEADQWTTEFGIFRAFAAEEMNELKNSLRQLEMGRYVYRRVQYVIGYTEPKLVYSLTPSGHRVAQDLTERGESGGGAIEPPAASGPSVGSARVEGNRAGAR